MGTWKPSFFRDRHAKKMKSHNESYAQQELHFVPLIVSTFGVLDDDFMRLLWLATSAARSTGMSVGEVREAGPSSTVRQHFFSKLRSRVAVAAATATAMRLDACAREVWRPPPLGAHVPSDASFYLPDSALVGAPIGAVSA